jgi:site-specific DNA recombinase
MRVLGAVRNSLLKDASTSPETQKAKISGWKDLYGHTLVHITEDPSVSGGLPAAMRPGIGPWLTQAELLAQWDILCASRFDRLCRNVVDIHHLIEFCSERGKTLVFVDEAFDLSTPHGKMVATILASVAQFQREQAGRNRAEAAAFLQKTGRWGGGKISYGYMPVKEGNGWILTPDPEIVPVAEWMAGELIAGKSATAVCRELNARGIPTSSGRGKWRGVNLIRIMRSPAIIGYITKADGSKVRDDDGVFVRRTPVLDDQVYADAQRALDRSSIDTSAGRTHSSLLRGVVFCAECESKMYYFRKRSRGYGYYRCHSANSGGGCHVRGIRADVLESLVTSSLLEALGGKPMTRVTITPAQDHGAELTEVAEALEHWQDPAVAAKVSAAFLADSVARLEARQADLRSRPSVPQKITEDRTGVTFGQHWGKLDTQQCRAVMIAEEVRVLAVKREFPPLWSDLPPKKMILRASEGTGSDHVQAEIFLGGWERLIKKAGEVSSMITGEDTEQNLGEQE